MGGQFLSTGAAGTLHPKIFSVLCAPKITSVESKKRKSYVSRVAVKYSLTFLALITEEAPF